MTEVKRVRFPNEVKLDIGGTVPAGAMGTARIDSADARCHVALDDGRNIVIGVDAFDVVVCSACGLHAAELGNIYGLCQACDAEEGER